MARIQSERTIAGHVNGGFAPFIGTWVKEVRGGHYEDQTADEFFVAPRRSSVTGGPPPHAAFGEGTIRLQTYGTTRPGPISLSSPNGQLSLTAGSLECHVPPRIGNIPTVDPYIPGGFVLRQIIQAEGRAPAVYTEIRTSSIVPGPYNPGPVPPSLSSQTTAYEMLLYWLPPFVGDGKIRVTLTSVTEGTEPRIYIWAGDENTLICDVTSATGALSDDYTFAATWTRLAVRITTDTPCGFTVEYTDGPAGEEGTLAVDDATNIAWSWDMILNTGHEDTPAPIQLTKGCTLQFTDIAEPVELLYRPPDVRSDAPYVGSGANIKVPAGESVLWMGPILLEDINPDRDAIQYYEPETYRYWCWLAGSYA
jgi:hypothetical protein